MNLSLRVRLGFIASTLGSLLCGCGGTTGPEALDEAQAVAPAEERASNDRLPKEASQHQKASAPGDDVIPCPVCGDGVCDGYTETCAECPQDCGACSVCGDGICNGTELCTDCPADCGACTCHDVCEGGGPLDAACGTCEAQMCVYDSYCCSVAWDSLCVSEVESLCGKTCP